MQQRVQKVPVLPFPLTKLIHPILPPHSDDLTKNEFLFSYVGLGTLSACPPMNPMRHLLPGACALFLLFCPPNAHALEYLDLIWSP